MLMFNQPLLINILGHAAGALIFAIFLALLFSGRGWSGARGRYLSALAAALSLAWNLGSLIVLAWPGLPPRAAELAAAFSFSVLSLLPAVLLHLSLGDGRRALVWLGYLLSSVAVIMHFWEIGGNGTALHQIALLIITVGFLVLTGIAVLGAVARAGATRIAASMCLALFSASFVHFGTGHATQAWSSELIVHHAGIPLALFVLLQDYRFVLVDAFVRFLANALLAATLTGLLIAMAFRLVLADKASSDPLHEAMLMISVCCFLVIFAWLRSRVQKWLSRAVFRQGGLTDVASRMKNGPDFSNEDQYLDWASAALAAAVKTKNFAVVPAAEIPSTTELHGPVSASALPAAEVLRSWPWAETVVPVRLAAGGSRLILLGPRQGGRRYLSEDLDALARAAAEIAETVERLRQREMNRLVSQAELRALQSQINPHFLFNALNTLYGTIPREAAAARRIVLDLSGIFRYFLQSDRTFVPLSLEMEIVRSYLEIEQLRLSERLRVEIEEEKAALDVPIPVLSVQPLVENAIKHSLARRIEPGVLRIGAELRGRGLVVRIENSGSGSTAESGNGVGLQNVRRRLEICYGPSASLDLHIGAEWTTAELCIPLAYMKAAG
jgi:two-component system, LytTR family, sensor kinase